MGRRGKLAVSFLLILSLSILYLVFLKEKSDLRSPKDPSKETNLYRGKSISEWLDVLKHPSEKLSIEDALGALGEIGSGDREVILELVRVMPRFIEIQGLPDKWDPNPGEVKTVMDNKLHREILETIKKIGRDAQPGLVELLTNKNETSKIRSNSAKALGELGAQARDAIPVLTEALKARHKLIRAEAASALGKMGRDASMAVPELTSLLDDNDESVRKAADEALSKIQ